VKVTPNSFNRKCVWQLLILLGVQTTVCAQAERIQKISSLYDCLKSSEIQHPKTVLAVAIIETGWMECHKCSYQFNNLFGFQTREKHYVKFANVDECIVYLKKWQDFFYVPWKKRHPKGTYYDFLAYMKYARNMPYYIRYVKTMERWISENIFEDEKADVVR
jgi:hypothetical protein